MNKQENDKYLIIIHIRFFYYIIMNLAKFVKTGEKNEVCLSMICKDV